MFPIESLNRAITGNTESLSNLREALNKLKSLSSSEFIVFLESPSFDDRIKNQFALFSFMSDPTLYLDEWLLKQKTSGLWRKIIIPADLKSEIRDKLDQSNISERILFPGLDGVCLWLRRHYASLS
ncbi:MAG: hypothetical protein ACTSQI_17470 [Candidatus Helarchaeota archaeon]